MTQAGLIRVRLADGVPSTIVKILDLMLDVVVAKP